MKFELNKNNRFENWDDEAEKEKFKSEIGGSWEEIGNLGFSFIKDKIKPSESIIDIGCGSLRIGRFLVDYLEPGNYFGVEMQERLLNSAVYDVIGVERFKEKKPKLITSSEFNFQEFKEFWPDAKIPCVGLAQSLFTHLNFKDMKACFNNLKDFVGDSFTLYATFHSHQGAQHEPDYDKSNIHLLKGGRHLGGDPSLSDSDSHTDFWYTREDLEEVAKSVGWNLEDVFDWNHPRYQLMTIWTLK